MKRDPTREGGLLLVTKLDRLARSAVDLLNIVQELQSKGVDFKALDQSLDMTTPAGKLQLQVLGAVAEFETAIRKERQVQGIARAGSPELRYGIKLHAKVRPGGSEFTKNSDQIPDGNQRVDACRRLCREQL
jgi:DNA invertase Pin-like site-specific DNA recombinase